MYGAVRARKTEDAMLSCYYCSYVDESAEILYISQDKGVSLYHGNRNHALWFSKRTVRTEREGAAVNSELNAAPGCDYLSRFLPKFPIFLPPTPHPHLRTHSFLKEAQAPRTVAHLMSV